MISDLIARAFATRNFAHEEHLRTRSYAAHMATGAFYDDVIEAVDAVAEAWQGSFGDLPDLPEVGSMEGSLLSHLPEEADWIEVNRMEIANDHNAIANLVDAVTAVYMSAIYKLSRFN